MTNARALGLFLIGLFLQDIFQNCVGVYDLKYKICFVIFLVWFYCVFLVSVGSCTPNGEASTGNRGSSEKANVLANPTASDKQLFRNDELRAKSHSLFDVEGSIDFDFCENGDIDLR